MPVPITVIYKIISGGQAPFAIELSRDKQSNSVSAKAAYTISAVCASIFYVLGAVLECFEVYETSKLLFGTLAFSTIAAGSLSGIFNRPLPVGPEEMDSSEESQDFDVTVRL